jgi:cardiolipin synthase A/B
MNPWRFGLRLACIAALSAIAACSTPPRPPASQATVSAAPLSQQLNVRDRNGAVAPAVEKGVIAAVKAEGRADLTEHHLRVLAATGDADLYRGNSTRLLVDGPATFAAMRAAIERARGRVLLESYIVEDSTMAEQLATLLARKVAQGVAVAMLYDAVGSIGTDNAYFDKLAAAGVAVCKFNPVNPLERPGYWGINRRDHRKVLVVDEEVAFTGGINISRVYSSGSLATRRSTDDQDLLHRGWRDTHIELRGPVVHAFGDGFKRVWDSQGCQGNLGRAPAAAVATPGSVWSS